MTGYTTPCSCGVPNAHSLAADEVVVHRQDGPCYFAPTSTTSPGADKGDRDLNDKLANSCEESTAAAALTTRERMSGRRAGSLPISQIVYDLTTVEAILRTRLAAAEARDHAALRERAEVAEAKVAAVCAEVDRRWPAHEESMIPNSLRSQTHRAVLLRALADRPAGGDA